MSLKNEEKNKKLSVIMKAKGIRPPSRKGKKWSVESKARVSLQRKGQLGRPHTQETKLKLSKMFKGKNGSNWQGGITSILETLRHGIEYKLWREAVFKRDNYTCIWCGQRGGRLNADHIKPFSLFPELRFAIDNGRTLCHKCHQTTETYGGRILKIKKGK